MSQKDKIAAAKKKVISSHLPLFTRSHMYLISINSINHKSFVHIFLTTILSQLKKFQQKSARLDRHVSNGSTDVPSPVILNLRLS